MSTRSGSSSEMGLEWPELPYAAWRETKQTLQLYLQVIGKLRLALAPMEPQWGQVPLYLTARGLNTSPIPHRSGAFDVDVDFVDHTVSVRTRHGRIERIGLEPRTVADFYRELMAALERAGVPVEISIQATEVPDPIPYPDDLEHRSYQPEWAHRFWSALLSADSVLKEHRALFRGKTSPVHFWWGTCDLAYARFSGRALVPPADAGIIERYGGDAEQAAAGFWPGDERTPFPAFFAYTYTKPDGIEEAALKPDAAYWSSELGEFLLPYDAVRTAPEPRQALLDFLESTYRAGAEHADWPAELAIALPITPSITS